MQTEKQGSTEFDILFLKLEEANVQAANEDGAIAAPMISITELDEINELRKLSLAIAQPSLAVYTMS